MNLGRPEDLPGCHLPLPLLGIDRVGAQLACSAFGIDRLYID
jgi:hypothetical protein